jgi:hypothetical protein
VPGGSELIKKYTIMILLCIVLLFVISIDLQAGETIINTVYGLVYSNQNKQFFPKQLIVVNVGEKAFVKIKQSADTKSISVGKIYGQLNTVNVLNYKGNYAFIEVRDYDTNKLVKGYIEKKYLKTVYPNFVWGIVVSLPEQQTYVYKNGLLVKKGSVSTGIVKNGWDTPTGTYLLGTRGNSMRISESIIKNWIRFNNRYMLHSTPYDSKGTTVLKELGTQASHGCIRMRPEDIKWIYENVPGNTVLLVHETATVFFDGKPLNSDMPVMIINGKTMVPARDIFELFDAKVIWWPEASMVSIFTKSKTIKLFIGDSKSVIDTDGYQQEILLDLPPVILNGQMLVPLRFMVETEWSGKYDPYLSKIKDIAPDSEIQSDNPEIISLGQDTVNGLNTDMDKVRAVHDWVAKNITYDLETYHKSQNSEKLEPMDAVSVLHNRKGVCAEYSNLTAAILRSLGFPSRIVSGWARQENETWQNHSWNEVLIEGRWLVMDTTWDSGYITEDYSAYFPSFKTEYFDPDPIEF